MEQLASNLRFVCDSVFTGIGLLLVVTPAAATRWKNEDWQEPTSFTRHFAPVGGYILSAIAVEAPQALIDFKAEEEKQLELKLHA